MDEQDIPIDIHATKLVDWLVSRRHVQKNWPDNVQVIREKINNAIQDMPEHPEVTRLLSGTYINYFHCLKIIEILKETEKDSRNILGWYGSQRMKDWQEVVKLYEKDNVYLAEAGQLLARYISYEIPAIKRQVLKGVQMQQDFDRRDAECVKGAATAKKRYTQMCKKIGIEGEKIKHELVDLLKTLPSELDSIADSAKTLSSARALYADFVSFVVKNNKSECVPLLKYIIEHGNVTTYEWTYGEPPCQIEEPKLDIELEDDCVETAADEIDFGDLQDPQEIDFGSDSAGGDIDWGNLNADQPVEIDWGIGEAEGDIATDEIVVEESGVGGGIARDTDAMTLLLNPKTRQQFIDELYEMEGFLKQRRLELQTEGNILSMSQFTSAPASVQDQTIEKTDEMLSNVQSIIAKISTTKLQHLFLISSSPRYVDRVADSLRSKLTLVDKLAETRKAIAERKKCAVEEQQLLMPKLSLFVDRIKELQENIEEHISKRYKGRPVNLMGVNLSKNV
ncbi:CDK5 regulatory subunit-associated protein 3-like [Macrobrachium nipponense]|uniref:CDK5 regulatory subunit-associated protein 3-like n=1 Tax=Macrobrachium nipponense TaxID=159736 RepID=UPI0030C7C0EE